jgi:hypothetical protein
MEGALLRAIDGREEARFRAMSDCRLRGSLHGSRQSEHMTDEQG